MELVTMKEAVGVLGIKYPSLCLRRKSNVGKDPFRHSVVLGKRAVLAAEKEELLAWNLLFVRGRKKGFERGIRVTFTLTEDEMSDLSYIMSLSHRSKSQALRGLIMVTAEVLRREHANNV